MCKVRFFHKVGQIRTNTDGHYFFILIFAPSELNDAAELFPYWHLQISLVCLSAHKGNEGNLKVKWLIFSVKRLPFFEGWEVELWERYLVTGSLAHTQDVLAVVTRWNFCCSRFQNLLRDQYFCLYAHIFSKTWWFLLINRYLCTQHYITCNMESKDLNRLKVVLAEKKRTNSAQPNLEENESSRR